MSRRKAYWSKNEKKKQITREKKTEIAIGNNIRNAKKQQLHSNTEYSMEERQKRKKERMKEVTEEIEEKQIS